MASRASLSEHDSVIANINAVDVAVVFGNGKRAFECVLVSNECFVHVSNPLGNVVSFNETSRNIYGNVMLWK